ncbi:MAG: hypothetical protein LBM75_10900 [Myxococcales bacterium]|nr:hypothetical protein [Myxococcales bacterium]
MKEYKVIDSDQHVLAIDSTSIKVHPDTSGAQKTVCKPLGDQKRLDDEKSCDCGLYKALFLEGRGMSDEARGGRFQTEVTIEATKVGVSLTSGATG